MAIGKTKEYSTREFNKLLADNGFTLERIRGSHYIYKRGSEEVVTNKNPNKMMTRRLIKEHNLIFQ